MYLGVGQQIYQYIYICIYITQHICIHLKNMTMLCGPKLTPMGSALATCNKFHRLNSQDVSVSCVSRRLLVETCFSTTWMSNSKTFWLKSLVPSENWTLVQGWVMILFFCCAGILEKMEFYGQSNILILWFSHISIHFKVELNSLKIAVASFMQKVILTPLSWTLYVNPWWTNQDFMPMMLLFGVGWGAATGSLAPSLWLCR